MAGFDRRGFLKVLGLSVAAWSAPRALSASEQPPAPAGADGRVPDTFPLQDPGLVRQTVGHAHGKFAELRALVEARPALANAAIDWGFGDWETAIGAASHTGQREIAEFLIAHGARPDLFTFAMLGNLAAVRGALEADASLAALRGPHGITLLAHAKAGGEAAAPVLDYLTGLGNAGERYRDEPLSDADRKALLGEYAFGTTARDRLLVREGMGGLTLARTGDSPRRLFHQGERAFHPAGAPAVGVRFEPAGGGMLLRITEADRILTATRSASQP